VRKIEKATPAAEAIAPEEPPGSGPGVAGGIRMIEADGVAARLLLPVALEAEVAMGNSAPTPT
jgi:hypothetical protein